MSAGFLKIHFSFSVEAMLSGIPLKNQSVQLFKKHFKIMDPPRVSITSQVISEGLGIAGPGRIRPQRRP